MAVKAQNEVSKLGTFEENSNEDEYRGSTVFLAVVRFALLLAAGLLSGAIFGVW